MKLEEAIRIIERDISEHRDMVPDSILEAEQLGIEALKRIHIHREATNWIDIPLLPGETKE